MNTDCPDVILASTSASRRALLARVLGDFGTATPAVDEARHRTETPREMAARLAKLKALSVAVKHPRAVVIGGDQVPCLGDEILRKPGSHMRAVAQLRACSGKTVTFYTAVCVAGPGADRIDIWVDDTLITFRSLSDDQIERYLQHDQPYDCAGSFKSESMGVTLFASIETADPTAIQGLPLIRLTETLAKHGVFIP